jgi:hypothetical protein
MRLLTTVEPVPCCMMHTVTASTDGTNVALNGAHARASEADGIPPT